MTREIKTSAVLNENNMAEVAGWVTVFNIDPTTRECISRNEEFLSVGVGIPAHSCLDTPLDEKKGFAVCRTPDNTKWSYMPDHRGETCYSTTTGRAFTMNDIGDYPADCTLIVPTTVFDKWDGMKWVTDIDAQRLADVNIATAKKAELIAEATVVIAPLADAKAGGYIDDADIPRLTEWQRYRYALTKVDVTKPSWPVAPQE